MPPSFTLIMATCATDAVGFPAVLNEMLVKAGYTFRPEYEVYARGFGVCVVEYVAALHIQAKMVTGSVPYVFQASGTYPKMAIQEVAHEAIMRLRYEHRELWEDPFSYLPMQGPEDPLCHFATVPVGASPLVRCMAETISAYEWAYEWAYRSVKWELEETRRCFLKFQIEVEPFVRSRKVPRHVLDRLSSVTAQEMAAPSHCFPLVMGTWAEAWPRLNPISMGSHMRQFPQVRTTR
uniref:Uncharacterized protein n=1 Tax=Setaria viridis TaxID=4556 RepID=A0A4U6VTK4_SETVI|nr:hypothetical protein SEVIR_3G302325v2 [Setaria viridis]